MANEHCFAGYSKSHRELVGSAGTLDLDTRHRAAKGWSWGMIHLFVTSFLIALSISGSYAHSAARCVTSELIARLTKLERTAAACEALSGDASKGKLTQRQVCKACKPAYDAQGNLLKWVNNNPGCFDQKSGSAIQHMRRVRRDNVTHYRKVCGFN